ncbi:CMRF35-like molecule 9 isoform X5 [Saccopteryx bilineata]|uniref:CMRF35-like molecule 9 isoform X5 n=1 Tax=Saccopteryx bilineata TaxID=59482 RepID=UPI00338F7936
MRLLVLLWGCFLLPGYGAVTGPKEISGFEGDTVSLQCSYEEDLRNHKKYWCKEGGIFISRCSHTVYAGEDGQENTEGRVSIQDSPKELRFNVTLRNLTPQDSGKYWCGVKKLGLDDTFLVSLTVLPGTSRPSTRLDSTSAKDTSLVPSSSSSKSRVSPPTIRILAPVLVLLALLLATGLAVLGRCMFRRRKEAQLTTETQKNEKAHLSQLPLGNGLVPEYAMINLAAPTGPRASPKPSASSSTDVRCLSQAPEEEEAPFQDPEGEASPGPPPHMSAEELSLSTFISV